MCGMKVERENRERERERKLKERERERRKELSDSSLDGVPLCRSIWIVACSIWTHHTWTPLPAIVETGLTMCFSWCHSMDEMLGE